MQAHEFSVSSEKLAEPNLPLHCANRYPSVASACPSTLSVSPITILEYPGSFLCNCNPYFCVVKFLKCKIRIKIAYKC